MQALAERLMALATAIHRELSLASADSSTAYNHTWRFQNSQSLLFANCRSETIIEI